MKLAKDAFACNDTKNCCQTVVLIIRVTVIIPTFVRINCIVYIATLPATLSRHNAITKFSISIILLWKGRLKIKVKWLSELNSVLECWKAKTTKQIKNMCTLDYRLLSTSTHHFSRRRCRHRPHPRPRYRRRRRRSRSRSRRIRSRRSRSQARQE